jgi:ABC-type transport system involved in multi-copper enzyme maturation permease subunit
MKALQWRPRANPIIVKELRSRMRGGRAFITLTAALAVMAAASYLLYRMTLSAYQYSGIPVSPQIGQMLFTGLAFLELFMVCAITPAVTAGAVSGEQEKLTYEMLLATPLRPASILWGKLVSALSYVFLLIFAAIPLSSLVFTFGGVALREMVKALAVLLSVTVMLGVMGLFFSAWLGRSGRATVASYLVVAGIVILPIFLYAAAGVLVSGAQPRWLLYINPLSAMASALGGTQTSIGPLNSLWMLTGGMLTGGWFGLAPISLDSIPRPIYHYSLPIYAGLTLLMYGLATRLVRPTRRWRFSRGEALTGLGLLALLAGAIALAFGGTADRYENYLGGATPPPVMDPAVQPGGFIELPPDELAPTFTPFSPPPEAGASPTPPPFTEGPIFDPTPTPFPTPTTPPFAPLLWGGSPAALSGGQAGRS